MKKQFILLSIVLIYSCEWPFSITPSDDEVFELSLSHSIERVMPSAEVFLNWTEITIENFNKFMIEKKREKDTTWTFVDELTDPFQLNYTDVITDDDDLTYRVGIVDDDDLVKWCTSEIRIPKTIRVSVPEEFSSIQVALESELTDDGDTVFVKSREGEYIETLNVHKEVTIISQNGFMNTIIVGNNASGLSAITMSTGELIGFTIRGSFAIYGSGGAINMSGNATIKNCLISSNYSDIVGGGVYMGDDASIYNSIIYSNSARLGGGGIYITNGSGEIINNTIIGNDVMFTGDCTNLIFRNNIVNNVNPVIVPFNNSDVMNFTIDYSLFDYDIGYGENNLVGDPQINDYYLFEISANSPCIDAGHPDAQYNDLDGTRNDIGAYGGPLSNH